MKGARFHSVVLLIVLLAPFTFSMLVTLVDSDVDAVVIEKSLEEENGDERETEKEVEIDDLEDFVLASHEEQKITQARLKAIRLKMEFKSLNYLDVITPPPEA